MKLTANYIIRCIVFILYLSYAFSPLCLSYSDSDGSNSPTSDDFASASVHLLWLHVIADIQTEDQPAESRAAFSLLDDKSSTCVILIKKKRALFRGASSLKPDQQQQYLTVDVADGRRPSFTGREEAVSLLIRYKDPFIALNTGLSPPVPCLS